MVLKCIPTQGGNMQRGKFNILLDGFHGSSGKGKTTTYLANKYKVDMLCSANMPNAGHTAEINGHKFIAKALPTAAILNRVTYHRPYIFVGPTAAFTIEQITKEIEECRLTPEQIYIHPRAGVVTPEHKELEGSDMNGPKSIASTCQGSGMFLADKILRRPGLKLARDYEELKDYVVPEDKFFPKIINNSLEFKCMTALHEVSQGIGLDINHGSHYPNCTSRQTNAVQAIADMGVRLRNIGDIYLNIHTTPIRVGNIVEGGKQVGYSGDFYPDAKELTWEEVGQRAGMPQEEIDRLSQSQLTTVTKRLRRVFEFSWVGLDRAVLLSNANKIIINFAQFIDWKAHKVRTWDALPQRVKDFVRKVESFTHLPVALIGTGIDNDNIVDLDI
jgi:adenylosuccinate synthase